MLVIIFLLKYQFRKATATKIQRDDEVATDFLQFLCTLHECLDEYIALSQSGGSMELYFVQYRPLLNKIRECTSIISQRSVF